MEATLSAPTTGASRLWAEGLTKTYRGRTVVNHVDIEVRQGEIVGLLGPNGAGKTTTFYMIVGLISPGEGTVHLDDEDLTRTPMYMRARKGIGYEWSDDARARRRVVGARGLGARRVPLLADVGSVIVDSRLRSEPPHFDPDCGQIGVASRAHGVLTSGLFARRRCHSQAKGPEDA